MAKRTRREPGTEPFILTRVRNLDDQAVTGGITIDGSSVVDGEVIPRFYVPSARSDRKFLVVTTSTDDMPILTFRGPFDTVRLAQDWAHENIPVRGNRWTIAPVDSAEPV